MNLELRVRVRVRGRERGRGRPMNARFRRKYGIRERAYRPIDSRQSSTLPEPDDMSDHSGTCRDCGQPVYWIRTAKSNKSIPLNNNYGMHSGKMFDDDCKFQPNGGMGRTAHFDTCSSRNSSDKPASPDRARQWETVSAGMAATWSHGELREQVTNLSRLIGIMEKSGADAENVKRTRQLVSACIKREFGQ